MVSSIIHRDRLNAYLLAGTGIIAFMALWVSYLVGLSYMRPPIAWSYTPIIIPQMIAVGSICVIAMAASQITYYRYPKLKKRMSFFGLLIFILATISNGVALWFMISEWFICVANVTSLNANESQSCDEQVWALWIQAGLIIIFFIHSLWGMLYLLKSWIEARMAYQNKYQYYESEPYDRNISRNIGTRMTKRSKGLIYEKKATEQNPPTTAHNTFEGTYRIKTTK